MTYSTLMVHLEPERPNEARLEIAGELAEQFNAKLTGVAAWEYSQDPSYAEGAFAKSLFEEDRAKLEERLTRMEEAFRRALNRAVDFPFSLSVVDARRVPILASRQARPFPTLARTLLMKQARH